MARDLARWDLAARVRRFRDTLHDGVRDEGLRARNLLSRFAPRRTGRLARSFTAKATERGDAAAIVSTHPGVHRVSDGGTIRPVRSRFLLLSRRRGFAANSPRFVSIPTPSGNRVIVDRRKAGRRIQATLAVQVTQRGTGFIDRATDAHRRGSAKRLQAPTVDLLMGGRGGR